MSSKAFSCVTVLACALAIFNAQPAYAQAAPLAMAGGIEYGYNCQPDPLDPIFSIVCDGNIQGDGAGPVVFEEVLAGVTVNALWHFHVQVNFEYRIRFPFTECQLVEGAGDMAVQNRIAAGTVTIGTQVFTISSIRIDAGVTLERGVLTLSLGGSGSLWVTHGGGTARLSVRLGTTLAMIDEGNCEDGFAGTVAGALPFTQPL